jgi:hypothetical protein
MIKLRWCRSKPFGRQTAVATALRWSHSADPPNKTAVGSELLDAERDRGRKMQCHFQETHGLDTLIPERFLFSPKGAQLKHFATGSSIRSAYSPIGICGGLLRQKRID